MKVLVLGGTGDADQLCLMLGKRGIDCLHSRAGTTAGRVPPYPYRDGGFGGLDGLARFLSAHGFSHVVLATHPFAARIAEHARIAAHRTGLPLVRLVRPRWRQPRGSTWYRFATLPDLASGLAEGGRYFLTVGRRSLEAFNARPDLWFLWRVIEPCPNSLRGVELVARPPFTVDQEIQTMRDHGITGLVSKDSGGAQTAAKIQAAATLQLPVYLVDRPDLGSIDCVNSLDGVGSWLGELP